MQEMTGLNRNRLPLITAALVSSFALLSGAQQSNAAEQARETTSKTARDADPNSMTPSRRKAAIAYASARKRCDEQRRAAQAACRRQAKEDYENALRLLDSGERLPKHP